RQSTYPPLATGQGSWRTTEQELISCRGTVHEPCGVAAKRRDRHASHLVAPTAHALPPSLLGQPRQRSRRKVHAVVVAASSRLRDRPFHLSAVLGMGVECRSSG